MGGRLLVGGLLILVVFLVEAPLGLRANVVSEANIKIAQEQGPNTCVIEEVPGTKHKIWTECKYWADRDICGRKAVVRYDCCEGYSRVEGQHGCTGVLPLQDVVKTARAAGASRFASLLESSGLAEQLAAEGAAYTVFAPSDQAMDELTSSQLAALRGARADNPILNYHVVAKKQLSRAWGADQQLTTRLRGTSLRVNKYSSKIETVNCATIVRKDHEASNGVVHVVDSLLDPERSTPTDLSVAVVQDGRFRQLSRLMQRSDLFDALRRQGVAYTLLAPNDEAFQKIPATRLQRLEDDEEAREALLRHLVLPHPVCLGAVVGPHRFPTRGPERLSFDCDARGPTVQGMRFGAGAAATADMTLATDGILYMLDDVPLPNRVKTLLQLVQDERLYSFAEVVRTAGLESLLDGPGDYTLFAPSEAAMASMEYGRLNRLRVDQGSARNFVMFHMARGRVLTETVTDNQVAQTLEGDSLRLQVYRKSFGVEDALIERADVQGLNGVLHVISKALHYANATLEETLRQDGNYTTFLRAMDRLREDSGVEFRGSRTAYTFLVPTDQAFQRLGTTKLHQLMANTSLLARTFKNHVVDDMVATESFRENLQYTVPTRHSNVHITKSEGKLRVNDATVLTCDRTNRQGVVHYINKVLIPEDHHVTVPPLPPLPPLQPHVFVTSPRTRTRWEGRSEDGQDDDDDEDEYVDPDLGAQPEPEIYRGRPSQEHRYREDHVVQRPPSNNNPYLRHHGHAQQQRTHVYHSAHHYVRSN